jgi:hypothetical protein
MILMTYRDNPEGDILSLAVLLFVLRNIHIVVMFHKMPPEIILTSTDDYYTTRFCDNLHQVHSKSIDLNVLGAITPKGLNTITNIS